MFSALEIVHDYSIHMGRVPLMEHMKACQLSDIMPYIGPRYVCSLSAAYTQVLSNLDGTDVYYADKKLIIVFKGRNANISVQSKYTLTAMLVIYALSQHNRMYNVGSIYAVSIEDGSAVMLDTENITNQMMENIAYNALGYNKVDGVPWQEASSINEERLYELGKRYKVNVDIKIAPPILCGTVRTSLLPVATLDVLDKAKSLFADEGVPDKDSFFLDELIIEYISDIHLMHHIDSSKSVSEQIMGIAKKLASGSSARHIIFCGDVCTDKILSEVFFKTFMENLKWHPYVYFVLGNHEYWQFGTVEEAEKDYKEMLCKYGVTCLCGEAVENENVIFLGGTGFSCIPEKESLIRFDYPVGLKMTHQEDKARADAFRRTYLEELEISEKYQKKLVVVTHCPAECWLADEPCSSSAVYFSGLQECAGIQFRAQIFCR